MKRIIALLLILVSLPALAQEIGGRVMNDKREPLPNATVQVYQGKTIKGEVVTDYDGKYTVKPLTPGKYNVLASFTGYDTMLVEGVIVKAGGRTRQNISFSKPGVTESPALIIKYYKKPLVDSEAEEWQQHIDRGHEILPTTKMD